jgi:hypothetical protein
MSIDMDLLLKIWAVLGPLIAGGASAVWSRRNQIQDREYLENREKIAHENAISEQEKAHKLSLLAENSAELKTAIANFMASANEYVTRQSECLTSPTSEAKLSVRDAFEKFNYNCQIVTLLANEKTANLVTEVWNASLAAPKSYNKPMDEEHLAKLEQFKNAKLSFSQAAREEINGRVNA